MDQNTLFEPFEPEEEVSNHATKAEEKASNFLLKAIVAPGRTVLDLNGKRCFTGTEIELSAADVKRLRNLGFLVDPSAPVIPFDTEPSWSSAGGPQIRRG